MELISHSLDNQNEKRWSSRDCQMYMCLRLKYPAIYFHSGLLPSAGWFLSWPVSSPNYRYTNQTGWSINSERRSPLISDFKKSYIKYCELQSIISDTLASNQDVLKSGRDWRPFLCVSPRCRKYRGFIVSFSVWERRGSIRVRTKQRARTSQKTLYKYVVKQRWKSVC